MHAIFCSSQITPAALMALFKSYKFPLGMGGNDFLAYGYFTINLIIMIITIIMYILIVCLF